MAKKRVTLLLHAGLARDLERVGEDAVAAEKLIEVIETRMRRWVKVNRPKFLHGHTGSLKQEAPESPSRATFRSAKREKMREFGNLLSQTRQGLEISSGALAEKLGWTQEFVHSIEAGQRLLSFHKLIQYIHTLKISVEHSTSLKEKLKELAPFVTKVTVPPSSKNSAENINDFSADSKERRSESERNSSHHQANNNNTRIEAFAKLPSRHAKTSANLSALSFAIFDSAGVSEKSNSNSTEGLPEQNPHILEECDFENPRRGKTNLEETISAAAALAAQRCIEAQKEEAKKVAEKAFFVALGTVVKELRKEQKLTRQDLAKKAHMASQQINALETARKISVDNMFRVAKALGLEPGQLAQRAQKNLPADYQVH